MQDLTRAGGCVFFLALQPKSGFLPEAGCGRPKLLKVEDGANGVRQRSTGPLSRPSPSANLAGNWKGDPLGREVRGFQVHPELNKFGGVVAALAVMPFVGLKIMLDVIYIGMAVAFFAAFLLYARGCEKL